MIAPLLLALAQPAPAILREPDIHGERIVFRCEGDVWIGDLATGETKRLTRHDGVERFPRFSPDGRHIAFTAEYDGPREAYVMPVEGGLPKRLTFTGDYANVLDWTPDGTGLLVQTRSFPRSFALKVVPVAGGVAERLPLEFASHGSLSPDGKRLAFNRFLRFDDAWFRYKGGLKNDIWVGDLVAKRFKKVAVSDGSHEFPVWVGDRIAYAAEGPKGFSVMAVSPNGGRARTLAGPFPEEVRSLQTDGKRIVFEHGFAISIIEADGMVRGVSLPIVSDKVHARPFAANASAFVQSMSLGPTGARLFVETRGRLYSVPVKQGAVATLAAKDGVRYRMPKLSPDGTRLAFIGDEEGEQRIYAASPDGSEPKPITPKAARTLQAMSWSPDSQWISYVDSTFHLRIVRADGSEERTLAQGTGSKYWYGPVVSWSPDSKWLAFESFNAKTSFMRTALYRLEDKSITLLGDGMTNDRYPAFSRDGKWLAFTTQRHAAPRWDAWLNQQITDKPWKVVLLALRKDEVSPFAPKNDEEGPEPKPAEAKKEFVLDLDGLYERAIEVPLPPSDASQVEVLGDRVLVQDGPTIRFYDLKAKQAGVLTQGTAFEVSADGKKVLVGGAAPRVVEPTGTDLPPTAGVVPLPNVRFTVEPEAEWRQIFWDAWRHLRDFFYAENMHGVDWNAIGQKYARYLPSVREREELTDLIRWMQAELGTSHMYRSEGDIRRATNTLPMGYLGWDLEPHASGYPKIAKLLRGDGFSLAERSPLLEVGLGVREGMHVIEVAGIPADSPGFAGALAGRAGETIRIVVSDTPSRDGARTVFVKPISNENTLRYREWVRTNREAVSKATNGRIGYLHLRAMVDTDMADFVRQYFPQRDKEALIIDVRFNNGGNVSNNVAAVLKQKVVAFFNQRNLPNWSRQGEFFLGPMACLINEFSISNGEEFPHHFKALGLGPLIGRRTTGGEVGSDPGWPMMDGAQVFVPNYGAWTPKDGWIIEGPGVSPDIAVESDPNAWAAGRDAQLNRAIEVLLAQLAKKPTVWPTTPPPPVRRGGL